METPYATEQKIPVQEQDDTLTIKLTAENFVPYQDTISIEKLQTRYNTAKIFHTICGQNMPSFNIYKKNPYNYDALVAKEETEYTIYQRKNASKIQKRAEEEAKLEGLSTGPSVRHKDYAQREFAETYYKAKLLQIAQDQAFSEKKAELTSILSQLGPERKQKQIDAKKVKLRALVNPDKYFTTQKNRRTALRVISQALELDPQKDKEKIIEILKTQEPTQSVQDFIKTLPENKIFQNIIQNRTYQIINSSAFREQVDAASNLIGQMYPTISSPTRPSINKKPSQHNNAHNASTNYLDTMQTNKKTKTSNKPNEDEIAQRRSARIINSLIKSLEQQQPQEVKFNKAKSQTSFWKNIKAKITKLFSKKSPKDNYVSSTAETPETIKERISAKKEQSSNEETTRKNHNSPYSQNNMHKTIREGALSGRFKTSLRRPWVER